MLTVNIYEKPKLELLMQPSFGHHIQDCNTILNYVVEELFIHKVPDSFQYNEGNFSYSRSPRQKEP